MKKITILLNLFLLISCQNFGQLKVITDLPKDLEEASGIEFIKGSKLIWIINDSGNKAKLYGISKKGKIKREISIDKKNKDWEDLTSDNDGNIYIGDFGNNDNERKNLRILKIKNKFLSKKKADVKKIEFEYEDQDDFSPKKKEMFFDAESFFYYKNYFYIFTKSRVEKNYGKTSMYKVSAKEGEHKALLIGEYDNGNKNDSWITAADISKDGKKMALLSQKNIIIFSDFQGDDFLSGKIKKIELKHRTQKEAICFKDNNTVFIIDERSGGEGGFLYELKL
jgi:WD40 repeat protein